jgi:hypothetical protein
VALGKDNVSTTGLQQRPNFNLHVADLHNVVVHLPRIRLKKYFDPICKRKTTSD